MDKSFLIFDAVTLFGFIVAASWFVAMGLEFAGLFDNIVLEITWRLKIL